MEKKIKSVIKPKPSAWQSYVKHSANNHNQNKVSIYPQEWTKTYYKAYARMQSIPLPPPNKLRTMHLNDVLVKRKSQRNVRLKSRLNLTNLSTILQYSLGLNPKYLNSKSKDHSRFYPSAGARYPIEGYVLMQNNDVLDASVYHYYVREHSLEKMFPLQKNDVKKAFIDEFITMYPCLLILSGFMPRTTIKYKDRGFNYALIEAGHIGQNVYLLATELGVQCCAIGGFIENEICSLLDIKSEEEYPLYVLGLK